MPEPLRPFDLAGLAKQRAVFALSRRDGWWFQRPRSRTHSQTLAQLLDTVRAHPELDVQLIPVSIFVGRAPDRDSGWFRVLFAENWGVVGRFRRLLALLLNGRGTIVHFATPVSLRDVLSNERDAPNTLRKVSRVLRAHFRRQRAVVIGPDLSHRRTLIDTLINAPPVQKAIDTSASKEGISRDRAVVKARGFAWEIAADQSHLVVRSASFLLTGLWDKIYHGVRIHHLDKLRAIARARNHLRALPSQHDRRCLAAVSVVSQRICRAAYRGGRQFESAGARFAAAPRRRVLFTAQLQRSVLFDRVPRIHQPAVRARRIARVFHRRRSFAYWTHACAAR